MLTENPECLKCATDIGDKLQIRSWQKYHTTASSNTRTSLGFVDSTAGWCVSLRLTGHRVRTQWPERPPLTSTTAGCITPERPPLKHAVISVNPLHAYGFPKLLTTNQIVQDLIGWVIKVWPGVQHFLVGLLLQCALFPQMSLSGAPQKQLFWTQVRWPGVGLHCVELPKAPFVSRSHLQLRPFVLHYSRTTAENSLSPVSLLLSPR